MYNKGISKEGDVLDLAVDNNIISKSGSWFEYDGNRFANGREAAKTYLLENPKMLDELCKKVMSVSSNQ